MDNNENSLLDLKTIVEHTECPWTNEDIYIDVLNRPDISGIYKPKDIINKFVTSKKNNWGVESISVHWSLNCVMLRIKPYDKGE